MNQKIPQKTTVYEEFKKPSSYEFLGDKFEVKGITEMYRQIIIQLGEIPDLIWAKKKEGIPLE